MQVSGICPICKKPSNRLRTCNMCHETVCSACMVHNICMSCYGKRHPKRFMSEEEDDLPVKKTEERRKGPARRGSGERH